MDSKVPLSGRQEGVRGCGPEANPVLLEPFVTMEITVPTELIGDISADLAGRRARIQGTDVLPGNQAVLYAEAPLSEVMSYSNQLKSITAGAGSYSMEYSHDENTPPNVQADVIKAYSPKEEKIEFFRAGRHVRAVEGSIRPYADRGCRFVLPAASAGVCLRRFQGSRRVHYAEDADAGRNRWADPYNFDLRREGVVLLSNAPFGGAMSTSTCIGTMWSTRRIRWCEPPRSRRRAARTAEDALLIAPWMSMSVPRVRTSAGLPPRHCGSCTTPRSSNPSSMCSSNRLRPTVKPRPPRPWPLASIPRIECSSR